MRTIFLSLLFLLPQAQVSVDELMGKINPSEHPDFVKVSPDFSRGDQILRKDAAMAFEHMAKAAAEEGISLTAISCTRNFDRQAAIWTAKWTGARLTEGVNLGKVDWSDSAKAVHILRFSSMPGTSRHHWGSDLDINSLNNAYFESGKGLKEYEWLIHHAEDFGFFQPYTSRESGRTGYQEEKWHWSYAPISEPFLNAYKARISPEMITGFSGSETAKSIQVIQRYVMGVSRCDPDLK